MSLRDWLTKLWHEEQERTTAGWLGKAPVGPGEGNCYFMIRCADVSLRWKREKTAKRLALLQSVVSVQHGDETLQIPATIGPDAFKSVGNADDFDRLVLHNIPLTGWIPYNGGPVELLLGLLGAPGSNTIAAAAGFLGSVAELVHVPQLTAAVPIANKIAAGAQDLLDTNENESYVAARLSLHDSEIGAGYYLIANTAEATVDPDLFTVNDDNELIRRDGEALAPMDYVLLQVETRTSIGSGWDNIPEIRAPYKQASAIQPDTDANKKTIEALLHAAMVAARFSPDLAAADRSEVRKRIRASWDEWNPAPATGGGLEPQSLDAVPDSRTPSALLDAEMAR